MSNKQDFLCKLSLENSEKFVYTGNDLGVSYKFLDVDKEGREKQGMKTIGSQAVLLLKTLSVVSV